MEILFIRLLLLIFITQIKTFGVTKVINIIIYMIFRFCNFINLFA